MSETSFDAFLPQVTLYMPLVSEPAAILAIRSAAIEFCQQSHIWMHEHDPITVSAGVNNYEFDPPCDAVVVRIAAAWYDGTPIYPTTEDLLHRRMGADWRTVAGTPGGYVQLRHDEVMLVPCPTTRLADALKMTVALAPSQASTTIDTAIYERWAEKIGFGARARLYATSRQPYSDANAALVYERRFREGIGEAKIERNRSNTRASNVMRLPNFI